MLLTTLMALFSNLDVLSPFFNSQGKKQQRLECVALRLEKPGAGLSRFNLHAVFAFTSYKSYFTLPGLQPISLEFHAFVHWHCPLARLDR